MAFASRVRFYCPLPLTLFREKTALRQQNTAVPPLLHPGATRTRAGCAYHPRTTRPVRVLKCPGRFCLFSTLTEYDTSYHRSTQDARGKAQNRKPLKRTHHPTQHGTSSFEGLLRLPSAKKRPWGGSWGLTTKKGQAFGENNCTSSAPHCSAHCTSCINGCTNRGGAGSNPRPIRSDRDRPPTRAFLTGTRCRWWPWARSGAPCGRGG
jgi:hypothetical protein